MTVASLSCFSGQECKRAPEILRLVHHTILFLELLTLIEDGLLVDRLAMLQLVDSLVDSDTRLLTTLKQSHAIDNCGYRPRGVMSIEIIAHIGEAGRKRGHVTVLRASPDAADGPVPQIRL